MRSVAKQTRRLGFRLGPVLLVLAVTVPLLSGCGMYKKWTLGKTVTKVEALLADAQQAEAPKYSYAEYTAADNALRQAQQMIEAGNYEGAEAQLAEAEQKAIQSKDNVPRNKAVITDRQKRMDEMRAGMEANLQRAIDAGGDRTAPEALEQAKQAVSTWIAELDQVKREPQQRPERYDELAEKGQPVVDAAQEAFNQARKASSLELADRINGTLERLGQIEWQTYLGVEAASAAEAINYFKGVMEDEKFAEAYERGVTLAPLLEELEAQAREARGRAYLERAGKAIEDAKAKGAVEYAVEPLNEAIAAHRTAGEAVEAGNFDQAYEASVQALEHVEAALGVIEERAGAALDEVKVELERSREEDVETYAADQVAAAQRTMNEASLLIQERDFLGALARCNDARRTIQQAVVAAQRSKAQRAIAGIEALIQNARQQGAAEYILADLNAVERELSQVRQMYTLEQYREVLPQSATVLKSAERLMGRLRTAADEQVRLAGVELERARQAGAASYAASLLQQASASLADASTAVSRDNLRSGLDLAASAASTAIRAANQAYMRRTEEMLVRTSQELGLAADAGAREHSAELFLGAMAAKEQSEKYLRREAYRDALNAATEAASLAEESRMNLIRRAQKLADAALAAEARKYSPKEIEQALQLLAQASDAMRRRDYPASNTQADQAYALAQVAYSSTWKQRSDALLAQVQASAQRARTNRGPEKSPTLYQRAIANLADSKGSYAGAEYDRAYASADAAAAVLSDLEADLGRLAGEDLDAIARTLANVKALGVDEQVRAQLLPVMNLQAVARDAVRQGDFNRGFAAIEQLQTGLRQLWATAVDYHVQQRLAAVQNLVFEYQTNGAWLLAPERHKEFTAQLSALASAEIEPASYEDAVLRLGQLRQSMIDVETEIRTSVEERISAMEGQLDQARREEAETYYPEEFQTALRDFTVIRNLPRGRNYSDIHAALTQAELSVKTVLNRAIVGRQERAYKTEIQDRVKEMNDLLNQFESVTMVPKSIWSASLRGPEKSSTEQNINIFRSAQTVISDRTFQMLAQDLRRRVREVKPPPTMVELHEKVLAVFDTLVEMADHFARFGDVRSFNREARELFLNRAYDSLARLSTMNAEIQGQLQIQKPFDFKIETELTMKERFSRWIWAW